MGLNRDIYLNIVRFLDSSTVRIVWANTFLFFIFYDSTSELVKNHMSEWNTFTLWFIDWRVLLLFIDIIILDGFLPLSRLIIFNPEGNFKFEGKNIIFESEYLFKKSLILKK
jgi:hypothetical protein